MKDLNPAGPEMGEEPNIMHGIVPVIAVPALPAPAPTAGRGRRLLPVISVRDS